MLHNDTKHRLARKIAHVNVQLQAWFVETFLAALCRKCHPSAAEPGCTAARGRLALIPLDWNNCMAPLTFISPELQASRVWLCVSYLSRKPRCLYSDKLAETEHIKSRKRGCNDTT